MSFQIGDRIGDYEVTGVLGTGGMGKVYKVRNVISERFEAMKVLLPNLAGDQELAERFLREIKLLATLDHPNIASLRTALRLGNQLLMIMELVEGTTLAQKVEKFPLRVRESIDYISQVCQALAYAHGKGVIHRDVKPANMMLTPEGVVKLMDFGIAKAAADRRLTMTGSTMGSLAYMSPEQIRAETPDARSDIYSLGASLYEIVTGKRPFQGDSDYALMAAHLQKMPVPPIEVDPTLPLALNEIIMMALAKDPAQRFQSADAFRTALESVKDIPQGVVARPGSIPAAAGSPAGNPPQFGSTALLSATQAVSQASGKPAAVLSPSTPVSTSATAATSPNAAGQTVSPPFMAVAAASVPAQASQATPPDTAVPESKPYVPAPPQKVAPAASVASYRGWYMTAGALIAILVIVLGAAELPKWRKTKAEGASSSTPSKGTPPAPTSPEPSSAAPSSPTSQPVTTQPSTAPGQANLSSQSNLSQGASSQSASAPSGPRQITPAKRDVAQQSRKVSAGASEPQPANRTVPAHTFPARLAPRAAEADDSTKNVDLKDLRKRLTQLDSRAHAIESSFNTLADAQRSQGLSPSPERTASLERLKEYMANAHNALDAGDAASAQENMGLAEDEVDSLEKFFGR